MKRALERHEQGKADVIPVLLRPVLYTDAPFAKLQMLPANRKPITRWRDRDSAFFDIACGIERAAQKYSASQPDSYAPPPPYRYPPPPPPPPHRRLYLLPVVVGFVAAVLTVVGFVTVLLQHPTLNPLVIYLFIGLLLLIAGVVAVRKVIGEI